MNAIAKIAPSNSETAQRRVGKYDWDEIGSAVNLFGCAVLEGLLPASECNDLAALYTHEEYFRSHVWMARHGFGKGEYRYFKYPLPGLVGDLRTALYPCIAAIANEWSERMSLDVRYPKEHAAYLKICHDAGQVRPTPLLLQYGPGDFNCLHQDVYGDLVFQLQVAILLSEPTGILPAAISFSPNSDRGCRAESKSFRFGKAMRSCSPSAIARCKAREASIASICVTA
jgi:uncharacterized protein